MINKVGQIERITQNRVVQLFQDELKLWCQSLNYKFLKYIEIIIKYDTYLSGGEALLT